MADYQKIAQEIVDCLSLNYEPVGVTLYDDENGVPDTIEFSEKNLKSYCQALVLAGKGEPFLLKKEQMGCKLGTSVLGFEDGEKMEAYLDDGVLEKYGVGLFGTEEASAETILKSSFLEKGKTKAAFIAPLSEFKTDPQVVVLTANSEQIMWLLYALNYDKGGIMNLPQSGGALGGCADITALPLLKGEADITFLGLGCRIKSGIAASDLMMGFPGDNLKRVHTHLLDMSKPISMLSKA